MDHGLELISSTLGMVELEAFSIVYTAGDIGEPTLPMFTYAGDLGN